MFTRRRSYRKKKISISRDSNVFTYVKSFLCNMLCISYSNDLLEIWSIKIWVPFFIMPSVSAKTEIIWSCIFVTSISRFLSAGTVTSIMIYAFCSKFFYCIAWPFYYRLSIFTESEALSNCYFCALYNKLWFYVHSISLLI